MKLIILGGEDFIQRTVIVGILLAFRKLTLQALRSVLQRRIPFMFASIEDFKSNLADNNSMVSIYKLYVLVNNMQGKFILAEIFG